MKALCFREVGFRVPGKDRVLGVTMVGYHYFASSMEKSCVISTPALPNMIDAEQYLFAERSTAL